MDPNETLSQLRTLSKRTLDTSVSMHHAEIADAAVDLASLVESLDAWISKGGFLPSAWQKGQAK